MRYYLLALLFGVMAGVTILKAVIPHEQQDVASRKCQVHGLAQYAQGDSARIDAAVDAAVLGNPQPAPATSCN